MKIITKLSTPLIQELKTADEIWVAVALLNMQGLNLILHNRKPKAIQNYLVGVDLPTNPKALQKLFELQRRGEFEVRIFTGKEFFHPKLYLFKKGSTLKGFIGSANCTNGGLNSNIELSVSVEDQNDCLQIQEWFKKHNDLCKPLTKKFLAKYKADYTERLKRKKVDEQIVAEEKDELNEEIEAAFAWKKDLLKELKAFRNGKEYESVKNERKYSVKILRASLDYPKFNKIKLDDFFSIWALGHIIALPKPTIQREINKFRKLLLMLCDEEMDVAIRYNLALKGALKIRGINEGLISKILTLHKPDLYFVKNSRSERALKKYGIELPRGMSKGDKYKITCVELRQICLDTDIQNLSVLDMFLSDEGEKDE